MEERCDGRGKPWRRVPIEASVCRGGKLGLGAKFTPAGVLDHAMIIKVVETLLTPPLICMQGTPIFPVSNATLSSLTTGSKIFPKQNTMWDMWTRVAQTKPEEEVAVYDGPMV